MKILFLIGVILFPFSTSALKPCPGKCMQNTTACKTGGGKILAYCTDGSVCCDFSIKKIGSCGSSKSGMNEAIFQSPNYPDFDSGDSVCKFDFALKHDFQGIAVEFMDVYMEGSGFAPHSSCESDMIFLKGFTNWQPPSRCGNLTGYVALIDKSNNTLKMKTLTVLAVMSSKRYKWKIRVRHQYLHKSDNKIHSISKDSSKEQITTEPESEILSEVERFSYSNRQEPGIPIYGRNRESRDRIMPDLSHTSSGEINEWEIAEPLVVNGEDAVIADVPWQASLRQLYPIPFLKARNLTDIFNREGENCTADGKHFCGGSIISDQHILSASHCFCAYNKLHGWKKIENVKIILGDTDLCSDDGVKYGQPSEVYNVEKIMFHYGYDDENMALNDVLVIKLKEKIKFTEYIKPIALSKRFKNYEGKRAKVSGWGLTNLTIPEETNQLPFILQSTDELYIENRTVCHRYYTQGYGVPRKYVEAYPKYKDSYGTVLCTTYKNFTEFKLVGQGDSGGPLVLLDEGPQPIQIGIVSYGLPVFKAANEHDNVFMDFFQDVSFYRDWIDMAMSV